MAWEALMFGGAEADPCWAPAIFGSKINAVMANSSTIHRSGMGRSAWGKIRKENSCLAIVVSRPRLLTKRSGLQSTAFPAGLGRSICHGRACPGHPRLKLQRKTWMPGTGPGMTMKNCQ
jgi:hypothetical protein